MGLIDQLIDGGDASYQNQTTSPYAWRALPGQTHTDTLQTYTGTNTVTTRTWLDYVESKESYGHPVRFLGRTNRNIGGKFVHTKFTVDKPGEWMELRNKSTSQWRRFSGMVCSSSSMRSLCTTAASAYDTHLKAQNATTGVLALGSNLSLDAAGATAISRVAPTNPLVDLSTSLAELYREGLPQVPGSAGNLGGEYLNVMFGYLPLYGDITSLRTTVQNAEKLLRQYERDSGRWIRRSYEYPEDRTSSVAINTSAVSTVPDGGLAGTGTLVTRTTTSTKTWFEGVFTYYLPRKGWRRTVAELDYLYGIKPGVDTAWQLTGFSRLADYFANIGDVMSNLNSFSSDGLVMPYGYVMREQHKTVEETWTGNMYVDGSIVPRTVTSAVSYVTHQRRLANPFGFGLTDGALSGRQQSILVALGISRL